MSEVLKSFDPLLELTDQEYRQISDLVYQKFGISLGNKKQALIKGRLQKVIRQFGFSSFGDFFDYVLKDRSGKALSILIDRLSTNHTYFYRENGHYQFLMKQVLPELEEKLKANRELGVRFWSAGCSSGEEAYTLAFILLDYFGKEHSRWKLGVLGTDISEQMLLKARQGIYSAENVFRLPEQWKRKYFRQLPSGQWQVVEEVRKMVLFRRLNLMRSTFPFKRKFQVIFCRNVMIYFDRPTREQLIARFYHYLAEGGYLFIGHSESIGRDNPYFTYVRPAVYRRKGEHHD